MIIGHLMHLCVCVSENFHVNCIDVFLLMVVHFNPCIKCTSKNILMAYGFSRHKHIMLRELVFFL